MLSGTRAGLLRGYEAEPQSGAGPPVGDAQPGQLRRRCPGGGITPRDWLQDAPPRLQAGHSGGVSCRDRTRKGEKGGSPGPSAPLNRTARSRSCSEDSWLSASTFPQLFGYLSPSTTAHPIHRPPSPHTNPKMGFGPWIVYRRNTGAHLLRKSSPAPPAARVSSLLPPAVCWRTT